MNDNKKNDDHYCDHYCDSEKIDLVKKYIDSLTEIEKKAMYIAQTQLASSFDIEKSIGFLQWKDAYNKN